MVQTRREKRHEEEEEQREAAEMAKLTPFEARSVLEQALKGVGKRELFTHGELPRSAPSGIIGAPSNVPLEKRIYPRLGSFPVHHSRSQVASSTSSATTQALESGQLQKKFFEIRHEGWTPTYGLQSNISMNIFSESRESQAASHIAREVTITQPLAVTHVLKQYTPEYLSCNSIPTSGSSFFDSSVIPRSTSEAPAPVLGSRETSGKQMHSSFKFGAEIRPDLALIPSTIASKESSEETTLYGLRTVQRHDKFYAVYHHRAKCDRCDKFNNSVMQRCRVCSSQFCKDCMYGLILDVDGRHWANEVDLDWSLPFPVTRPVPAASAAVVMPKRKHVESDKLRNLRPAPPTSPNKKQKPVHTIKLPVIEYNPLDGLAAAAVKVRGDGDPKRYMSILSIMERKSNPRGIIATVNDKIGNDLFSDHNKTRPNIQDGATESPNTNHFGGDNMSFVMGINELSDNSIDLPDAGTSSAVKLQAPAKKTVPGSENAPWVELTAWEFSKLRKRAKQNPTWHFDQETEYQELRKLGCGVKASSGDFGCDIPEASRQEFDFTLPATPDDRPGRKIAKSSASNNGSLRDIALRELEALAIDANKEQRASTSTFPARKAAQSTLKTLPTYGCKSVEEAHQVVGASLLTKMFSEDISKSGEVGHNNCMESFGRENDRITDSDETEDEIDVIPSPRSLNKSGDHEGFRTKFQARGHSGGASFDNNLEITGIPTEIADDDTSRIKPWIEQGMQSDPLVKYLQTRGEWNRASQLVEVASWLLNLKFAGDDK